MKGSKLIKEMQTVDLQNKIKDIRKDLIKLNAAVATGSVGKNPGIIRKNRKIIARMLTQLRAREGKLNG